MGGVVTQHWFPFCFRNELDLLECQLVENYDYIYRFILVESALTFQGGSKPLYFAENKERFSQWADKIIHLVCELPADPGCSPWVREAMQRDYAQLALAEAEPDDIVIVQDVDEIPNKTALAAEPDPAMCVQLRYHPFAVDWAVPPESWGYNGTLIRKHAVTSLHQIRLSNENYPHLADGGWHLSWFGGHDDIEAKLYSFAHTEHVAQGLAANQGDVLRSSGSWDGGHGTGIDVDQVPMPRWIQASWDPVLHRRRPEGPAPAVWFRPREDQ